MLHNATDEGNGGPNNRKLSIEIMRMDSTSLKVVEGTQRNIDWVNAERQYDDGSEMGYRSTH